MISKAEVFGQTQYHAARHDWTRAAALFDDLASIESKIALAI